MLRKKFKIEPGDPMVALANSKLPNFKPPEVDLEGPIDFSKGPQYRLEDLVARMTKENRHEEVNWGSPMETLTIKAASIVLPVLRAKKLTPKQIRKMLEEIRNLRTEIHGIGKQKTQKS
jgi:hypothetical protein